MKSTLFTLATVLLLSQSLFQSASADDANPEGQKLYQQHCASCHHPERIGLIGPPLLPLFLNRMPYQDFQKIMQEGLAATQMPAFDYLNANEQKKLWDFIKQEQKITWSSEQIQKSLTQSKLPEKKLAIDKIENLTAVVERGASRVWVMQDQDILDYFPFANIHGGIKYKPQGEAFYIPGRDGWIGKYDLKKGRFDAKVRSSIYLRNISLDREGKHLIAANWLPQSLVIFDSDSLKVKKNYPVEGKISAIYELSKSDQAVFTFRDQAKLGILNTKTLALNYLDLDEAMEDFFIDPTEQFLIGTYRHGKVLKVYDLKQKKVVFEHALEGMPHLFSAAIWYNGGDFYFATPHIGQPYLSVWKMYDWQMIKQVDLGGDGFFVRTHSDTPYLWADNGSDELVLIDKKSHEVKKIVPVKGKKFMHTEFSGDGQLAYASIYEPDGELTVYDSATLEVLKRYPANMPVGKYNFVHKQRQLEHAQLGKEVFMAKCWGCHHTTEEAFGPSFKWIVNNREESWIRAQILNPKTISKHLGYERNVMPKLNVNPLEMEALIAYMKSL